MSRNLQYILIVSFVSIIALVYICIYRQSLRHLLNLFFCPNYLAVLSAEEAVKRECKSNEGFADRCNKEPEWKNEQMERFTKQFSDSVRKLRGRIFKAFIIVALILLCAFGIAYVAAGLTSITPGALSIIQIVSAFLILWGIIGLLGYSIQTIAGESIPETLDYFWFLFLNAMGIFSLFFTQFYSFFKKL